jgi:branched-chain amino acid transport system substrate-binding protein
MRSSLSALGFLLSATACSPSFKAKTCALDTDCASGQACMFDVSGSSYCDVVASVPLNIGMSAPISGPQAALGTEMKRGIDLAFDEANAAGGIHGRPLQLSFLDDQYDPTQAEANARKLTGATMESGVAPHCPTTNNPVVAGASIISSAALDRAPTGVLAMIGNVGTPTMLRAAPVAIETKTLFFAPFTGAAFVLRDGSAMACSKYIFNVRASYANEERATIEYFHALNVPDATHVVSFDQNDSFGQSGYDGLTAAYPVIYPGAASQTIPRYRYTKNDDASVDMQIAAVTTYLQSLLAGDASSTHTVGIAMTSTYGAGARFIGGVKAWLYANDMEQGVDHKASRLSLHFSAISFVGANAFAAGLIALDGAKPLTDPSGSKHSYTEGVIVSQVVPNYFTDTSDIVSKYLKLIGQSGATPSFTSLEGYISGTIFVAGLRAHQGAYTADALIPTFENLPNLSLGLGATASFADHQYSKSVWGTAVGADGKFTNVYFWSSPGPIQLYEGM